MIVVYNRIMFVYHKHHIIPRHSSSLPLHSSTGGSNASSNKIQLTLPDHAEAHRLLWAGSGCLKCKYAWLMLSGRTNEAEILRLELAHSLEANTKRSTAMIGNKCALGHKHSLETRTKMSGRHRLHSLETRAKMSLAKMGNAYCLGRKLSLETRQKMSRSRMGNKNAVRHKAA